MCDEKMEFEQSVNLFNAITASSFKQGSEPASVLIGSDNTKSWSPRDDDQSPFIQIELPAPMKITSIVTKGGQNGQFVPKFTLQTSPTADGKLHNVSVSTVTSLDESDETAEVFNGNSDDSTPVMHAFGQPIVVAVIRIYPIRSEGQSPISLKVEIRGCLVESASTTPATVVTTTTTEVVTNTPVGSSTTSTGSTQTGPIVETTTTVTKVVTPTQEASSETTAMPTEIVTTSVVTETEKTTTSSFSSSTARQPTAGTETVPSETTEMVTEALKCDDKMGLRYGTANQIVQPSFDASSNADDAEHARLDYVDDNGNPSPWRPDTNDASPWVSVTFKQPIIVTSLEIQGSDSEEALEFQLEYRLAGSDIFVSVLNEDNSAPKVFSAQVRDSSVVQVELTKRLESVTSLKVYLLQGSSFRFEVRGCYHVVITTTEKSTQSQSSTSTTRKVPSSEQSFPATSTGFVSGVPSSTPTEVTTTTHSPPTSKVVVTSTTTNVLGSTTAGLETTETVTSTPEGTATIKTTTIRTTEPTTVGEYCAYCSECRSLGQV